MKAERITDDLLDEIVISIIESMSYHQRIYPIVTTDKIAEILWKKHRVPIWKQVETVREKMRSWWKNKQQHYEPYPHKWIGDYPVHVGSPMNKTYSMLEKGAFTGSTDKGLIIVYTGETLQSILKYRRCKE